MSVELVMTFPKREPDPCERECESTHMCQKSHGITKDANDDDCEQEAKIALRLFLPQRPDHHPKII